MASVAVCTNAARVTSHIVDCYLKRQPQAAEGVVSICAVRLAVDVGLRALIQVIASNILRCSCPFAERLELQAVWPVP